MQTSELASRRGEDSASGQGNRKENKKGRKDQREQHQGGDRKERFIKKNFGSKVQNLESQRGGETSR